MLRLIVIDDELPARRGLKRLLQAHENVDIVGEASSLDEAQELAQVLRPDALFLDIDLGGDDGFALIDRLDPVPAIVFVTAHSTYAPQAFDVAAVDFLLKPVDEQRLALTLERLRHHRRSLQHAGRPSIGNEPKLAIQAKRRLHLRMTGRSIVVATDEIAMLTAEADYTRILMADARNYLVCRLLGQFETELPTPPFFRVSRSLVINLDRVERVRSHDGGRALLSLGSSIAPILLGRTASKRLRRRFDAPYPAETGGDAVMMPFA